MDTPATKHVCGLLILALALLTGASYASVAGTGACAVAGRGYGILSSSLYPSDPPSNQRCQWTLTAYSNKVIGLYFEDFDLSRGSVFEIYNGSTATSSSLLTSYTGGSAVKFGLTLDKVVTLVFRNSPLSLGHRGFLLIYYSTDVPQRSSEDSIYVGNETIMGGGSLRSPGYSGWYPNSARYTWTLRSCEVGAPLRLVFETFALEQNYDRVLVYDGETQSPGFLLSSFSGNVLPPDLTLGSVATVVFISDNVGSNRGFAARFSTVIGSNVITADSASTQRACSASCPTNVQLDSTYCYAHDDPHMRTFDGVYYELQRQGIFYLYKHDAAPIWVQAAFQTCNTYATCSCAVGVRYWGELFVVDRCMLAGSAYRPNRVYKLGSGSMMKIELHGVGFQVTLPNGLRVVIGSSWKWIGRVDLYPAYADRNVVQGLCGLYNGNPSDDGTYRCGFNLTSGSNPWETWRVPDGEVVFTASMPRYAFNMSSCNCSHVPKYALPHGVLNATGLPPTELSDGRLFNISDAPKDDERDWPPGWSQDTATQYCRNYIENNQAIRQCAEVLNDFNIDELLNDCIRDIYLTRGTSFALTALEASKEKCINSLALKNITILLCVNDCSKRGQCVNGTCICQAGFYGVDCSTNPGNAPYLRNTTAHPSCSPNGEIGLFCNQEQVFGETFYDVVPTNPKCTINATSYVLLNDGTTGRFLTTTLVTVTAIYQGPSALICRLPELTSNTTAVKILYTISVSNDGFNYSNSISASRMFIPPCGGFQNDLGSITSPNYPLDYRNNASCLWNLTASASSSIELALRSFALKEDGDSVQVFDQGCLIDSWKGTQQKQSFVYGPTLALLFTSGASGSSRGFNLIFNSVTKTVLCGGNVVDRGILVSPNYPSFYTRRTYCVWKLVAGVGKTGVSLQFNAFDTEEGSDFLSIYNGTGSTCVSVDKLSGDNLPPPMRLGSSATIVFRTDEYTESTGFSITFTSY